MNIIFLLLCTCSVLTRKTEFSSVTIQLIFSPPTPSPSPSGNRYSVSVCLFRFGLICSFILVICFLYSTIIVYMSFSDLFHLICSKSIHVVTNGKIFFF